MAIARSEYNMTDAAKISDSITIAAAVIKDSITDIVTEILTELAKERLNDDYVAQKVVLLGSNVTNITSDFG